MSNYPIPIMELASKVQTMHWRHHHSWQALYQMKHNPDELMNLLARQAASAIAQQFTGEVIAKGLIETRDEQDGKVMTFSCVALRRDELLDLLYLAYCEGVSNARERVQP